MQYIRHRVGMRNDPRIVRLVAVEGQACKGAYWDLLEILCERGGRIEFRDCASIAYELRISEDVLERIIKNYGLFGYDKKGFWDEGVLEDIMACERKRKAVMLRWKGKVERVLPRKTKGSRQVSEPYKVMVEIVDMWNECITDNRVSEEQVEANKGRWMRHIKKLLKIYGGSERLLEKFEEVIRNYDNLWEGVRSLSSVLIPGNFTDILNGRYDKRREKKRGQEGVGEERLEYPLLE